MLLCLCPGRRLLGIGSMLGIVQCTLVAAAIAVQMFVVTRSHFVNVSKTCFVLSSEGATTPARTSSAWRMFVNVFADGTRQIAECSQYYKSYSVL